MLCTSSAPLKRGNNLSKSQTMDIKMILQPGDLVLAAVSKPSEETYYFSATVLATLPGNKIMINWNDNDADDSVKDVHEIKFVWRPPTTSHYCTIGEDVEVYNHDFGLFYPATVKEIRAYDSVLVEWKTDMPLPAELSNFEVCALYVRPKLPQEPMHKLQAGEIVRAFHFDSKSMAIAKILERVDFNHVKIEWLESSKTKRFECAQAEFADDTKHISHLSFPGKAAYLRSSPNHVKQSPQHKQSKRKKASEKNAPNTADKQNMESVREAICCYDQGGFSSSFMLEKENVINCAKSKRQKRSTWRPKIIFSQQVSTFPSHESEQEPHSKKDFGAEGKTEEICGHSEYPVCAFSEPLTAHLAFIENVGESVTVTSSRLFAAWRKYGAVFGTFNGEADYPDWTALTAEICFILACLENLDRNSPFGSFRKYSKKGFARILSDLKKTFQFKSHNDTGFRIFFEEAAKSCVDFYPEIRSFPEPIKSSYRAPAGFDEMPLQRTHILCGHVREAKLPLEFWTDK